MRWMLVVLASLSIALGASVSLADKKDKKDPPEEPPKKEEVCSPGYFKNHTEVWYGECCDVASGQCDDLLTALEARGPGGSAIREAAQDFLNGCFEEAPCAD